MMTHRRRSVSGGSYKDMMPSQHSAVSASGASNTSTAKMTTTTASHSPASHQHQHQQQQNGAKELLEALLQWRDAASGRSFLHDPRGHYALAEALLDRTQQLDEYYKQHHHHQHPCSSAQQRRGGADAASSQVGSSSSNTTTVRHDWLTCRDLESAYTPLHWAVYRGDLAFLLLLLRHALLEETSSSSPPRRISQRPMPCLQGEQHVIVTTTTIDSSSSLSLLQALVTATDHEGMTAGELLAARQRPELLACRWHAVYRPKISTTTRDYEDTMGGRRRRRRRTSFDLVDDDDDNEGGNEQNEFDLLSQNMHLLRNDPVEGSNENTDHHHKVSYSCEVFTFGRAHHCALGVGQDSADTTKKTVRPQRVQAFAGDVVGRQGGAVAVAAAAHHTLVVTAAGHLYAFGLGKAGRLGTGGGAHCPLPTRVMGVLSSRHVVSVAAAENHSLCVTKCGQVFAWGSNRFGQVSGSDDGNTTRCLPRRVDDLKNVFCVSVAAGAKHSVALSKQGEIYVWGDNTAGQLGISRRSGTHKVQRVEALWNSTPPKRGISIAASAQATLVLTIPSGSGIPVNSIYSWGHGSHVPTKVHFEASSWNRFRPINPISIACARHHNVAVTSDGMVYTWGLHEESLGTSNSKAKQSSSPTVSTIIASPQLVTGMLPENGGGFAVGVSASENHTAVLTDAGALFTWGATYGTRILGHEGVRWQPDPKRVPGVYRAVGVAAAKEHMVLLIGASFPPMPSTNDNSSLEDLAAQKICQRVDLFNILPILIVAERTNCTTLIEYCMGFVRRNLDGVLNVGQKSVMNCYLNEQIMGSLSESAEKNQDGRLPPLLVDVIRAGSIGRPSFEREALACVEDWLAACEVLSQSPAAKTFVERYSSELLLAPSEYRSGRTRRARSCSGASTATFRSSLQKDQGCSEHCLELTTDMDLSSTELAEAKRVCLVKELRGVRKRLSQIERLEQSSTTSELSREQHDKIARRPQLEADLLIFEPALESVEKRLKELRLVETTSIMEEKVAKKVDDESSSEKDPLKRASFRCDICRITCPDERSYTLHMNGRKHRNRVAQVEEEEKKSVAASIMEQKQCQIMLEEEIRAQAQTRPSAWNKEQQSTPPKFKLPAPPHPVPDSVVSKPKGPVSLRDIMEEESSKSQITQKPLKLPKGSAPPLKSPPWASSPVATLTAPSVATLPAPSSPTQDPAHSLGDYLSPKLSPSPPLQQRQAAWSSPHTPTAGNSRMSFRDIQQQEQEFKSRQDQTVAFASNGKWFMEQRERAGSMKEIQTLDEKEREERLFIEEQYRIEKQIEEELASKKPKARAKTRKQSSKGKSRHSMEDQPRDGNKKSKARRSRGSGEGRANAENASERLR